MSLFTFDLKSGYHHIEVVQEHRKYLGFEWKGNYFQFTVLPYHQRRMLSLSSCNLWLSYGGPKGYKQLCTWMMVYVQLKVK